MVVTGDNMYQIGNSVHVKLKCVLYRKNVDPVYRNPHRKANSLVFYTKGGHSFSFGNLLLGARAGQVVLLPYGGSYENRTLSPDTEYYQIEFELLEQNGPVALCPQPVVFAEPPECMGLFERIYERFTGQAAGWQALCLGELLQILGLLESQADSAQRQKDPVEKAAGFLQENYTGTASMEELAKCCSVSVSALEKGFGKRFGMTPVAYRNSLRVRRAVQLLASGHTIEEAAVQTGFSDRYYFTKIFKRITGQTPGAFMRENEI